MAACSALAAARRLTAAPFALVLTWITFIALPDPILATSGQWTTLKDLGGEAIHLALIPDPDASYPNRHSQLIWWQNEDKGNVLRWPRPVGEDAR